MLARFRFDPGQSEFKVQAIAAGLLSFAGHSPTFAIRDYRGGMGLDGDELHATALDVTAIADSLALQDRVGDRDRDEIEGRMKRDVLEVAAHPEIAFRAEDLATEPIAPGRRRLFAHGQLSLHGVTRPHRLEAELQLHEDALRLLGVTRLRLSDYRIRPVSALGGAITLKDELTLTFDLIGLRDRGEP